MMMVQYPVFYTSEGQKRELIRFSDLLYSGSLEKGCKRTGYDSIVSSRIDQKISRRMMIFYK